MRQVVLLFTLQHFSRKEEEFQAVDELVLRKLWLAQSHLHLAGWAHSCDPEPPLPVPAGEAALNRGLTPAVTRVSQSRGLMCRHQELNKHMTAGTSAWAHLTSGLYHQGFLYQPRGHVGWCHWGSCAGKTHEQKGFYTSKGTILPMSHTETGLEW